MKDVLAELSLAPEICGALTGAETPFTDAFKRSAHHGASRLLPTGAAVQDLHALTPHLPSPSLR